MEKGGGWFAALSCCVEYLLPVTMRDQFVLDLAAGTTSMIDSTIFLRLRFDAPSSRFADVRPARCSIRSRFISFANSRQNSSKKSWRISFVSEARERTRSSTS